MSICTCLCQRVYLCLAPYSCLALLNTTPARLEHNCHCYDYIFTDVAFFVLITNVFTGNHYVHMVGVGNMPSMSNTAIFNSSCV